MLPLYDTVRIRRFPLVNVALIAANILVFLYELQLSPSALKSFIFTWGLIPARLTGDPSTAWPTIFSAMFLHGSWVHLLGNMWFLHIFGDNVEARMGKLRYLLFYLLSGVAAVLLQTYLQPDSQQPMIGASGAIAGVLGAYLISFPRARIASLVPILFIFTIIEVPAALFLIIWFLIQVYSGLFAMQGASASGIAWWAHIGGFIFGLIMVFFFSRRTVYSSY
jgi:membrane associated rhomboid family serine protease